MFDFIFGGVSSLFLKRESASIDNLIFKCHYRGTGIILVMAFALVTSRQFVGSPIHCMTDSMSSGVMDSYCWLHSTFSVSNNVAGQIGQDHSYPGVGPLSGSSFHHHKYYQWVVFVLSLQIALFHLPRLLWKSYEGGVMKLLTNGLTDITAFMDGDTKSDGLDRIRKFYSVSGSGRGKYFLVFFFCEILNFVNIVGQIFMMDRFLGYQFTTYGTKVLAQTEGNFTERADHLNVVFPKVAKCIFKKFGVSGSIQTHDALCVLPLNIINEKIYVALWFWFIFLAAATGAFLLYRLVTIISVDLRTYVLYSIAGGMVKKDQIRAALENPEHNTLQRLGDYLMLYLLTKNLNPIVVKDMYNELVPKSYMANHAKEEELMALNSKFKDM